MTKRKGGFASSGFAAAKAGIVGSARQGVALLLSLAIVLSPPLAAAKEKEPARHLGASSVALPSNGHGNGGQNSNDACKLGSGRSPIKHVIYIQFDNVHFERDNPNVPSDLEQMPHLLNFLTKNGTVLTNSHTPLISHTSVDILTSLTGVYGDGHGVPIGNSFGYFPLPNTSTAADLFDSSFTYWTDQSVGDPGFRDQVVGIVSLVGLLANEKEIFRAQNLRITLSSQGNQLASSRESRHLFGISWRSTKRISWR